MFIWILAPSSFNTQFLIGFSSLINLIDEDYLRRYLNDL